MKGLKSIFGAIAIAAMLSVSFGANAQENANRDENGKIVPLMKCRGRKAAQKAILDLLAQKKLDKKYYIGAHTNNEAAGREFLAQAKEVTGLDPLFVSEVSLIIGTHVGPDAVAVAFCEE